MSDLPATDPDRKAMLDLPIEAMMGAWVYWKQTTYKYLVALCIVLLLGYGVIAYILVKNAEKTKIYNEQKVGLEKVIEDQTLEINRLKAANQVKISEASRTAGNYDKTINSIDLSIFSNSGWQAIVSRRKAVLGIP